MVVADPAAAEQPIEEHPLFHEPVAVPDHLDRMARERGWPAGLLERALSLRVPHADLDAWLRNERMEPAFVSWQLDALARVFDGPLRLREATWRDGEALADLYAHAPETVRDWRLVVERGPNPYAQFRLQEHPNLQVVECRGILLGAAAHACRNTYIGGERYSVHFMSAWRVREGFRGYGLSNLLRSAAGPGTAWFGPVTYWYERIDNASAGWLEKMRTMAESRDNKVDGLTASVHLFERQPEPSASARAIRPLRPDDVPRCVELINSTHAGLDLFRPYTAELLEIHLDDPSWGPKPDFIPRVYGWDDAWVVEDGGSVIACGGLWDRGRDVREVWTSDAGDERTIAPTALLDWGHAEGHADAMADLVRFFLGRTAELGRSHLLAPFEHAPDVLAALAPLMPVVETRALRCMGFNDQTLRVEAQLTRPYTDLAYW